MSLRPPPVEKDAEERPAHAPHATRANARTASNPPHSQHSNARNAPPPPPPPTLARKHFLQQFRLHTTKTHVVLLCISLRSIVRDQAGHGTVNLPLHTRLMPTPHNSLFLSRCSVELSSLILEKKSHAHVWPVSITCVLFLQPTRRCLVPSEINLLTSSTWYYPTKSEALSD